MASYCTANFPNTDSSRIRMRPQLGLRGCLDIDLHRDSIETVRGIADSHPVAVLLDGRMALQLADSLFDVGGTEPVVFRLQNRMNFQRPGRTLGDRDPSGVGVNVQIHWPGHSQRPIE